MILCGCVWLIGRLVSGGGWGVLCGVLGLGRFVDGRPSKKMMRAWVSEESDDEQSLRRPLLFVLLRGAPSGAFIARHLASSSPIPRVRLSNGVEVVMAAKQEGSGDGMENDDNDWKKGCVKIDIPIKGTDTLSVVVQKQGINTNKGKLAVTLLHEGVMKVHIIEDPKLLEAVDHFVENRAPGRWKSHSRKGTYPSAAR